MFLAVRRLVERGARWLVRHGRPLDLGPTVDPVPGTGGGRWSARLPDLARSVPTRDRDRGAKPSSCAPTVCRPSSRAASPRSLAALGALVDRRRRRGPRRRRRRWSRGVLLRARRSPAARLAPRSHRRAAPCRPVADRGPRRAARRRRRPAPRARRGRARDDRRRAEPSARVDEWVAAHADAVARYRSVLVRRSKRAACSTSRRSARRAASSASSCELVRRYRGSAERCAGRDRRTARRAPRSHRTRRGRRRPGAPTPTRGTGRGPGSRRDRARAPAGTRAAARTPSCRRRARRRRGWRRAPRARAATAGGAR